MAARRSFVTLSALSSRRCSGHPLRGQCRLLAQSAVTEDLKRTCLYDFHLSHGGKMVPFAGWSMPVQYPDLSIINSCLHTRKHASMFDVSHMLQMTVTGSDAQNFLEHILIADLVNLKVGHATLSMFTTSTGGIIDDCIVTRTGSDSFYIVSNASRADVDLNHMKTQLNQYKNGVADVQITPLPEKALIALQGPQSVSVLQEGVKGDLTQLKFMNSSLMELYGISDCRVSRCGYTGEDGFEISVPVNYAIELANKLLQKNVKLAGLGARDILRLEAGLCLYGNDISEETTPIEAGLTWCISKRRRKEGRFVGADRILKQIKEKPSNKRIGLEMDSSGPPARQHCQVLSNDGNVIGTITSGSPSPTLQTNIAMAYVPLEMSKIGTELNIKIRKHIVTGRIVKMPFVPTKYYH